MNQETIAAVATGTGGAMAVIRVSGAGAIAAVDAIFRGRTSLMQAPGGRFFYGNIVDTGDCDNKIEVYHSEPEQSGSTPPSKERHSGGEQSGSTPPSKERHSEGERSEPVESASEASPAADRRPNNCHSERFLPANDGTLFEESSTGIIIDDVVVSIFRTPHSYTGEDVVEISCHGSRYIQNRIMQLLAAQDVRPAAAGEFTMRALLNGRMALAQAEAVADIIAAENRSAHRVAASQMRGAYSGELSLLREELVRTAALLELELDFGEEEVEFADRTALHTLVDTVRERLRRLSGSFATGNALKNGVPVAIVGQPNVGKSTLLNALLGDDRAMVSNIAGTTRDTLEECVDLGGIRFRFVDTAGVRQSADPLEQMGIERTHTALARASVVLLVVECGVCGIASAACRMPKARRRKTKSICERSEPSASEASHTTCHSERFLPANDGTLFEESSTGSTASLAEQIATLLSDITLRPDQKVCVVVNKVDAATEPHPVTPKGFVIPRGTNSSFVIPRSPQGDVGISPCLRHSEHERKRVRGTCERSEPNANEASPHPIIPTTALPFDTHIIPISALRGDGLEELRAWLVSTVDEGSADDIIVSNTRHFDALTHAAAALDRVADGVLNDLPLDLVTQDLREALHYLGLLTGAITTDELLQTIFSKFCIGK